MSKVKFKLNRDGVRSLLKSDEMKAICSKYGSEALSRCPVPGYEMQDRHYPERNGVAIVAVEFGAKKDNSENNTLLKVVN